jgi:Ca-activated chloride channel family protein
MRLTFIVLQGRGLLSRWAQCLLGYHLCMYPNMLPVALLVRHVRSFLRIPGLSVIVLLALFGGAPCRAQQPQQSPPPPPAPPPPPPAPEHAPAGYAIQRDVNLVLLHVSVEDENGQFVPGLAAKNFRIFEDNVEQKIDVLRQEDAPVSIGLLVDNSGSMFDKRASVNDAAVTLVKNSNPEDEVFVAHFNENYFFDLNEDFTKDIAEMRKALDHAQSGGATALFDAIVKSLDRLKRGYSDKKVLLIVSDGEDNSSHGTFQYTMEQAQKSNDMIYAVGLLSQEKKDSAERDKQVLSALSQATGGAAFFPQGLQEVESICTQIAHDIRHQYTLAYYPTKPKDGTYRALRVELIPPAGSGKLSVRTRTGYFAGKY